MKNLFSKHDNRHAFQNSGYYFGHGLGKRMEKDIMRNQHCTGEYTTVSSQSLPHYVSVCGESYRLSQSTPISTLPLSLTSVYKHSTFRADSELLSKFQTVTKGNFRRYPRCYSLPDRTISVNPSECAGWWWYTDRPKEHDENGSNCSLARDSKAAVSQRLYVTPLSVLAATQQPLMRRNTWKYAYKK